MKPPKPPVAPPPLDKMAARKVMLEKERLELFEKWKVALEEAEGNISRAVDQLSPRPPRGASIRHRVYALVDPRNGDIRYVGQSRLKQRLALHIGEARRVGGRRVFAGELKSGWILELLKHGMKPFLIVLEEATDLQDALVIEAWWIRFLTARGCRLSNYVPSATKTRQIYISLPSELIDELTVLANGDYVRRTEIIRDCLLGFVRRGT